MIARNSVARRMRACAILAIACMVAGPALAQDPRAGAAQRAAREWLALVDKLDVAASFAAAGDKFRAPITQDAWGDAIEKARAPLGPLVQRTIVETAFDRAAAPGGGPEIDIVVFLFRTAFANRTGASESVTLALDSDGVWRVIGYFIR
jgi:hypothetical protein